MLLPVAPERARFVCAIPDDTPANSCSEGPTATGAWRHRHAASWVSRDPEMIARRPTSGQADVGASERHVATPPSRETHGAEVADVSSG
ncbi:unnamed protein product [Rangifer tarandus platyrhynchus]|uniref:Uncharacterized protein n=2 Tax=Rangifer tarandus platyrhynchus TaxID=3082113 RepID=A0ABN8ZIP5_RANTA|nr:unnamed protein product [Rangifer tarandus platyrhynchus]CAI9708301.1 unnamed protein product [Rangifer tarandus platyrhynchus]